MTHKFYVSVNPEEGVQHNDNSYGWANSTTSKNNLINQIQTRYPLSTICVYELKEMQRVTGQPTYARYKTNDNGEILPL